MCMLDYDDTPATTLKEKIVKARKPHKCRECYRIIGIGERYLAESLIGDGGFFTHQTCAHCVVVRQWLLGQCGGFLYGGLKEDIVEHVQSEVYPFYVRRLAAGMRRKWTKKNGALMNVPSGGMT